MAPGAAAPTEKSGAGKPGGRNGHVTAAWGAHHPPAGSRLREFTASIQWRCRSFTLSNTSSPLVTPLRPMVGLRRAGVLPPLPPGAMARSLGPQRHRGIETACPPRRYARREHRDPGHEDGHGAEDRGIQRSNVEQHRGHQSNERKGREQAEARSCDHERRPRARDTRPRRASHPSCCRGRATRRPEGLGRWRAAPSARPSALSPCRPPRWTSTRGATRPDRAAHGRARRSRSQTAACSRPRRARRWRLSSRRRAARA